MSMTIKQAEAVMRHARAKEQERAAAAAWQAARLEEVDAQQAVYDVRIYGPLTDDRIDAARAVLDRVALAAVATPDGHDCAAWRAM